MRIAGARAARLPRLPLFALVPVLGAVAACDDEPGPARVCAVGASVPDATFRIGCARDYERLGYEDDPFTTFARTRSVSVVVDRQDGGRVYFLNTARWWLHFDFVFYVLEGHAPGDPTYSTAHAQFNALNYRSENRRYLLGKIVQYLDQDRLVFSLAAGDRASAALIAEGFDAARTRLYDGDALLFRPVSNDQEKLIPDLVARGIPIVTSAELFAGQTYQPLNPGVGYGHLRFRKASQLQGEPPLPVEIVVLDRVPSDISVVSGIVTAEFQTPLSHVNILAKNRGTPNMALRDAWQDATLRGFEGELVKLTVTSSDFAVEPATLAEAQAYWDAIRPAEPLVPAHDLQVTGFLDLQQHGLEAIAAIGAKAANFGQTTRVSPAVRMPLPARAIPFSAFERHMTEHGLWPMLEAIVAEREAGTLDDRDLERRLFQLRWAIYEAPLDPTFRAALVDEMRATWGDATRVRFRSSTNVEDLKSFSGAGLYTSVGVALADGEELVEKRLKVVWASVYNYAAFVEREFYRVDQRQVMMGVLVNPAFVDEAANGVALTINEFTNLRPAFYINAQVGEISVANPTGEAIPEQILWYTYYQDPEYEVLSRSSLFGGAPVLADPEYQELAGMLTRLSAHFRWLHCRIEGTNDIDPSCALDVEWKLTPAREVYVKQVRPLRGR